MFDRLAHFRNLTTGIHGPFRPEPCAFDITWSSYDPRRKGLDQSLRLRPAVQVAVQRLREELAIEAAHLLEEARESAVAELQAFIVEAPARIMPATPSQPTDPETF